MSAPGPEDYGEVESSSELNVPAIMAVVVIVMAVVALIWVSMR